jgi:lipoate-protein ligase A
VHRLRVLGDRFPGRPAYDTAVSRALLEGVAEGRLPETLRLYRPDDVLAFSVLDRTRPGFPGAVAAARARGFEAMLRLAGGRAAVFHRATLAFAWVIPSEDPRRGIHARFDALAQVVVEALRGLGVDARVGAVPGEYCPGEHSVNAGGRTKIMGVGQRLVRGAAHVGGVIVVGGSERVREVLRPVYDALGFEFDPDTVGSVEDEVGPIGEDAVADALRGVLARRFALEPATVDAATLARARGLEAHHRPEAQGPAARPLPEAKGVAEG